MVRVGTTPLKKMKQLSMVTLQDMCMCVYRVVVGSCLWLAM